MHPLSRFPHPARVAFALLLAATTAGVCDNPPSAPESLSIPEENLVGLWSRYRSSNARTEYIRFNPDRTACYFEIGNANWSKLVYRPWSSWNVDEANPLGAAVYRVIIPAAGIDYTWDYGHQDLYPSGYSNVLYARDGTVNAALTCSP